MKLYQYIKTLLKAVITFSAAQQIMGQTLESQQMFDIHCPRHSLDYMVKNEWSTITSDFLASYDIQYAGDKGIIGNSEWTLTPYSYSDSEQTDIIRDGNYYARDTGSSPTQGGGVCLFFEPDAFIPNYLDPWKLYYPIKMDCYYKFDRNESHRAREGIDEFSLSTKLKPPIFSAYLNDVKYKLNGGYVTISGSSAYAENPYKCGGMYQLPYQTRALACNSFWGAWYKGCDLMSAHPSIPDEKLSEMNLTYLICPKEKKCEETTEQKTSECNSAIISKFFNRTQECNCNCNCNLNVQLNTTELEQQLEKGKKKKNDKNNTNKRLSCSIL